MPGQGRECSGLPCPALAQPGNDTTWRIPHQSSRSHLLARDRQGVAPPPPPRRPPPSPAPPPEPARQPELVPREVAELSHLLRLKGAREVLVVAVVAGAARHLRGVWPKAKDREREGAWATAPTHSNPLFSGSRPVSSLPPPPPPPGPPPREGAHHAHLLDSVPHHVECAHEGKKCCSVLPASRPPGPRPCHTPSLPRPAHPTPPRRTQ